MCGPGVRYERDVIPGSSSPWTCLARDKSPGGSKGGTPGSVMAGRRMGPSVLGSVPGASPRVRGGWSGMSGMAGPVRVGARGVGTGKGRCFHRQLVAASESDCRQDGSHRGSRGGRYSVRVQLRRLTWRRTAGFPTDPARAAGIRVGKERRSYVRAGSPSCRLPGPGRLTEQRGPRAGASRR